MTRRPPNDERQLLPLSGSDRYHLRSAAVQWRRDPALVNEGPPWVLAHPPTDYEKEDEVAAAVFADERVIAAVFAVHPIAPLERGRREPWLIRGLLRANDAGPLTLDRVTVEHLERLAVEVTGTVLRGVPLARIRDIARSRVTTAASVREAAGDYFGPEDVEWARKAAREASKLPLRRGRTGYPREHYRRIALRAGELADERRDVVVALAEEEQRSYDAIKRQLVRAREFGFLPPTTQGRADFTPGPNLYRKDD